MVSSSKSTIIVLERKKSRRDSFRLFLPERKCIPFFFEKETSCLDNIKALDPDLVILGSLLSAQILRVIHALRANESSIPVLVISEDPAVDQFVLPHNFERVRIVQSEGTHKIKIRSIITDMLKTTSEAYNGRAIPLIVGDSAEMMRIKGMINELSRSTEPVLIGGEPGTGKELMARALHCQSDRGENRFVKIDCASLSGKMDSSFGYDSVTGRFGAFILDVHLRKLKRANTGTLFFEEIGKIPPSLQTQLLLILEESAISDPASQIKTPVDIRIVASTSIDLNRLVESGEFRKDLYFRLKVFSIAVPSLRNRKKDIPFLVDYLTDRFCMDNGRSHFDIPQHVKNVFTNYSWPGNVGEMEDTIKQVMQGNDESWMSDPALLQDRDSSLKHQVDVNAYIDSLVEFSDVKNYTQDLSNISLKHIAGEFIARVEKKLIGIALERTNRNRMRAAMMLEISYKHLLHKIKAYHLI